MKKLLVLGMAMFATSALAQPDMAKYDKSCKVCHATGAAGAPKVGDAAAWEPRLAKGMCFDCSDADYTALIEYMSTPAE